MSDSQSYHVTSPTFLRMVASILDNILRKLCTRKVVRQAEQYFERLDMLKERQYTLNN